MPQKRSSPTPPVPTVCTACGKTFPRLQAYARRRPNDRPYCSTECSFARPFVPPITYSDDGLTATIPLYGRDRSIRAHVMVDAADAERANQWNWSFASGYAVRYQRTDGKLIAIRLHRELLGLPRERDGRDVDHINRNRLDCRRANLRAVPYGKNSQNVPSLTGSSSIHRGVSWHKKTQKWTAQIHAGGRLHYLGEYATEEEAAEVARQGRLRLLPYATD